MMNWYHFVAAAILAGYFMPIIGAPPAETAVGIGLAGVFTYFLRRRVRR